jgi:hypothetical protein
VPGDHPAHSAIEAAYHVLGDDSKTQAGVKALSVAAGFRVNVSELISLSERVTDGLPN